MIRKKIAVACGGTGGHIFPGLAIANILLKRGHDVTIWMAGKDIESEAVKEWNGKIITIPTEGFQYGLSLKSIMTLLKLFIGIIKAIFLMKNNTPNIVLAMGSYASIAPCIAAIFLKIPYILHEANTVPGRAVSLLSSKSVCVAISFKETKKYLNHSNIIHTGMPLRNEIQKALINKPYKKSNDYFTILITGGSRGARVLNSSLPHIFSNTLLKDTSFKIIHIIGNSSVDIYEKIYKSLNIKADIYTFVHDIEKFYLESDLVIARSGASTCTEICAFGLPSILIPYPYAIHDHQLKNAKVLEAAGAALVINEKELKNNELATYIYSLINSPEDLLTQSNAAKSIFKEHGSNFLSDLIESFS